MRQPRCTSPQMHIIKYMVFTGKEDLLKKILRPVGAGRPYPWIRHCLRPWMFYVTGVFPERGYGVQPHWMFGFCSICVFAKYTAHLCSHTLIKSYIFIQENVENCPPNFTFCFSLDSLARLPTTWTSSSVKSAGPPMFYAHRMSRTDIFQDTDSHTYKATGAFDSNKLLVITHWYVDQYTYSAIYRFRPDSKSACVAPGHHGPTLGPSVAFFWIFDWLAEFFSGWCPE